MNVIAEIHRINQAELDNGAVGTSASWHAKYAESAWVYVGNLPMQLTEGDVICVLSQFGEVEDVNLVRDDDTGKSKGFAFLKYEDSRSCVLAVDNLTGSKILGRSIRVDHVEKYRLPKHLAEREDGRGGEERSSSAVDRTAPGHAYKGQELASSYDISQGQDLFAAPKPLNDPSSTHNDDRRGGSREAEKEAKRARKEERDRKRREKEARRERKEEKRRAKKLKKRKKHAVDDYYTDDDSRSNDDLDMHSGFSEERKYRQKGRSRSSRKKRRKRSRSRSRSRSWSR